MGVDVAAVAVRLGGADGVLRLLEDKADGNGTRVAGLPWPEMGFVSQKFVALVPEVLQYTWELP